MPSSLTCVPVSVYLFFSLLCLLILECSLSSAVVLDLVRLQTLLKIPFLSFHSFLDSYK